MIMKDNDIYKGSRIAYIFEQMFEYFVLLLITGGFLVNLLAKIGISNTLNGIISSFVVLSCTAQVFLLF